VLQVSLLQTNVLLLSVKHSPIKL